MYRLLIFFVFFTISTASAQNPIASLYITISDVQSVMLKETLQEKPGPEQTNYTPDHILDLLKPAASQVQTYKHSFKSDLLMLKNLYSGLKGGSPSASLIRKESQKSLNQLSEEQLKKQLLVYEIAPR